MFKIIIADDNALTREALRTSFLWKACGFRLIGEAKNGTEALELLRRERPDAALIDIKMPGLTGLEVIKRSREEGINCMFLILSAYDEFSYAQQGVKLGAFDYLLKPADDGKLREVLGRLGEKLKENEKREQQYARWKQSSQEADQKIQKTDRALKSKLLGDSVNGIRESSELLEAVLRRDWQSRGCELLLIVPDGEEKENILQAPGTFVHSEEVLLRNCEKKYGVKLLELWRPEGLLVLVSYRKVCMRRDYDLLALKIAEELLRENRKEKRPVRISISNFSERCGRLPEAFEEALLAYNSRFFFENSTVIHYGSMQSKSVRNEYRMSRKMQEVYEAFREQPEELPDKLEEFFCMVSEEAHCDVPYVKNIFIQLAMMMSHLAKQKYPGCAGVKEMTDIMAEVRKISGITEIFSWLRDYARRLIQAENGGQDQIGPVSRKAIDFLNVHYMEHIALPDVAEAAGVSESHLCRSLKQDTGETFVSLLNKIRIQKAIRLLREGEHKVYEIADIVGFGNYAYFYQMFKRITGCSPREFQ